MKKILLLILFPFLTLGQTQIGTNIYGENDNDGLGTGLAISADGNTVAVGTPNYDYPFPANAGKITIYQRNGNTWTEEVITTTNPYGYTYRGRQIFLSDDGNTLLARAYSGENGVILTYKKLAGVWTFITTAAEFTALNGNVALSGDGSTIAFADSLEGAGVVRIYKLDLGQETQATFTGTVFQEYFGDSIDLSYDGNTIAITSTGDIGIPGNRGKVEVYRNTGGTWSQVGGDIVGIGAYDRMGQSVKLSADGNTMTTSGLGDASGFNAGLIRIYANNAGAWTQIGADITGELEGQNLGVYYLDISADGTILVAGTTYSPPINNKVFQNISNTWIEIGAFSNSVTDTNTDLLNFGPKFALSADGTTVATSYCSDDATGPNRGVLAVYDLTNLLKSDTFVLQNFTVSPNPSSEIVTITLKENLEVQKINLYNPSGQVIKSQTSTTINVQDIAKGTYFLEVITNKGKATKTIVVK
jgi:hypothetical protein